MAVDLASLIRAGDTVLWSQGCGEPRALTEALMAQRHRIGYLSVFLGATFSDTLKAEYADCIQFRGIGGIGSNAVLSRAGVLDVVPVHVSALPGLITSRVLPVDVVLVQLSPAGPDGRHSLGLVADYVRPAMTAARVVVAEVNQQVPYVRGPELVGPDEIDVVVHTDRPPVELSSQEPDQAERRIGELVAGLIPDGAVIQLGVGTVPAAVGSALRSHRDLGVHSGVVGDWLADLVEAGAVTNRLKRRDRHVSVTGGLFGSRRLYDFAHDNPAVELRPLTYTHDRGVLAELDRLHTVNSAVEVDLSGQVNAEVVGGHHIGTVGGQVDFVRAGTASAGGRSLIALKSTAAGGRRSRIVAGLSQPVVTTARSDVDVIVTEFGVADLRGASLGQRAERLIAVSHPDHRAGLRDAMGRTVDSR
ncbi:MAG: acetyl-CoA hydrolase/transferase family protein [Acidobacteriota bacterium]|nr:acetyl-CoA hydrolase/transferase family protein [Acidobacteriota bacterium]